jgi:hypothetical protein
MSAVALSDEAIPMKKHVALVIAISCALVLAVTSCCAGGK